jgi:hypothetical protein
VGADPTQTLHKYVPKTKRCDFFFSIRENATVRILGHKKRNGSRTIYAYLFIECSRTSALDYAQNSGLALLAGCTSPVKGTAAGTVARTAMWNVVQAASGNDVCPSPESKRYSATGGSLHCNATVIPFHSLMNPD